MTHFSEETTPEQAEEERKALILLKDDLFHSKMGWWAQFRYWLKGSPTHCAICGAVLEYDEEVIHFSKKTGKPDRWLCWIDCPKWDWHRDYAGNRVSNGHEDFRWIEREYQ